MRPVTPNWLPNTGATSKNKIKGCAKDISSKYINPSHTLEFAILFVPTESLYAEILRQPGLSEQLQRDYRVMIARPTNLAALLTSSKWDWLIACSVFTRWIAEPSVARKARLLEGLQSWIWHRFGSFFVAVMNCERAPTGIWQVRPRLN